MTKGEALRFIDELTSHLGGMRAEPPNDIFKNLELVSSFILGRDEEWRRWVVRIETAFRGRSLDGHSLLFLEGYPPPDQK